MWQSLWRGYLGHSHIAKGAYTGIRPDALSVAWRISDHQVWLAPATSCFHVYSVAISTCRELRHRVEGLGYVNHSVARSWSANVWSVRYCWEQESTGWRELIVASGLAKCLAVSSVAVVVDPVKGFGRQ